MQRIYLEQLSLALVAAVWLTGCVYDDVDDGTTDSYAAKLIHNIDFETGDLDEEDLYREVQGPNASVSINSSVKRNGDHGLRSYVTKADRRAEVLSKYKRGTVGGVNWYGWSVYVPTGFPGDGRFDIITQWHDFHKSQPSWAKDNKAPTCVLVDNDSDELRLVLKYQNGNKSVAHKSFSLGGYQKGAWHDFVMHVRWTHQSSGFLELWVNGVKKIDYQGPTYMNYGSGNGPYFKAGIYKGSANWKGTSPRVMFFDDLRMGGADSSYKDVDPAPSSPSPSGACAQQYGTLQSFQLCSEQSSSCEFYAKTAGASCASECAAKGGACLGAYDNGDTGTGATCTRGGKKTCDSELNDQLCICSLDSTPTETCEQQFGDTQSFELCSEQSSSCEFYAKTAGSTCASACEAAGAACLGAYDNGNTGTGQACKRGGKKTCDTSLNDQLCICSRS